MQMTPTLHKVIAREFPGKNNAGLRKHIRSMVTEDGDLTLLRHTIALTAQGTMSLGAVIRAWRDQKMSEVVW